MSIGAICNRQIPIATSGTSVLVAVQSMQAFDEPVLIVTDERGGRPVGIVTEHELARNVVACRADPSRLALKDVMRASLGFVNETDSVFETASWMHRNRLREAIVHDNAGVLVGIVTMERLIDSLAGGIIDVSGPDMTEAHPAGRVFVH